LSATIGDPVEYIKDLGITNANYIRIESSFNFDNSPIYFFNQKKMGYKDINANLPWLYDRVNAILNLFPNQRGIIHTVSYDLTLKLIENLTDDNALRLVTYSGTEEKKLVLDTLKNNENAVLIGPSLLEGIDLPDDYARFTIFLKVPHLSLHDKFVSAKLKINAGWYSNKAVTNILQGVGRGIRHQNDWCKTFILDANFGTLLHYNRNAFPPEFINRIKLIS
jgi:Rad3-related DNA helicase